MEKQDIFLINWDVDKRNYRWIKISQAEIWVKFQLFNFSTLNNIAIRDMAQEPIDA